VRSRAVGEPMPPDAPTTTATGLSFVIMRTFSIAMNLFTFRSRNRTSLRPATVNLMGIADGSGRLTSPVSDVFSSRTYPMTRVRFILFLLACGVVTAPLSAADRPPNVILVFIDDK